MLELRNVEKSYRQGNARTAVLKGIDFSFERGEWYTVYGSSGSGKTTLLNVAGGLERPDSGDVYFDGAPVYGMGDRRLSLWRNRSVGFVFQFFHLINDLNVEENIKLPLRVAGKTPDNGWFGELVGILGIKDLIKRNPATLSGGEQQRVAMARALINRPDFILADEPTGNLDSVNSASAIELMRNLRKRSGIGIVLATHERELAESGDTVLNISDGKLEKVRGGI